jgi:phospholipid/cholesterol/gamma-HCH transport system permease protein
MSSTPQALARAGGRRVSLQTQDLLEDLGDILILTGRTLVSAVRSPYPYGGELVSQFLFALRLCWLPLVITSLVVAYGAPGLQAANFLILFGALDRLGGFFGWP